MKHTLLSHIALGVCWKSLTLHLLVVTVTNYSRVKKMLHQFERKGIIYVSQNIFLYFYILNIIMKTTFIGKNVQINKLCQM